METEEQQIDDAIAVINTDLTADEQAATAYQNAESALTAQQQAEIASLQAQIDSGAATPEQVQQLADLQALDTRLKADAAAIQSATPAPATTSSTAAAPPAASGATVPPPS